MPAKSQDEYLPSGALIYVAADDGAVWNDGYACWFASPAKRRQYVATRMDGEALLFSLRAGRSGDRAADVWMLFDRVNGHAETKRYVWIFPTKALCTTLTGTIPICTPHERAQTRLLRSPRARLDRDR